MPFEDAVQKITRGLQQQGFGIITAIDLKEKLKQNPGVNFRNYRILGACNPEFAYKAVSMESHVGLMLPCNVVVQEHENGEIEISAINPLDALDKEDASDQLKGLAAEVGNRLRATVDDLNREKSEPERTEALPAEMKSRNAEMPILG